MFHTWITGTTSLAAIAADHHLTRQTLHTRFSWCWLITPEVFIDTHRIYDQIFIDGTYLNNQCLLIASTTNHVVCWHWCATENKQAYITLLSQIPAPLIVTLDGGQGAYTAIKTCWPTTTIQRCLVHVQRAIRRHTTSRPRTDAGKAIYGLALALTKVTTAEQATQWVVNLHNTRTMFTDYLNEKTRFNPRKHPRGKSWEWTHLRDRKALNSLEYVYKQGWIFPWITPPQGFIGTPATTTNPLEGGFNSQLKLLARLHRGMTPEHQRTSIDWWLASKTQVPGDPVTIARHQRWGQDALAKVRVLLEAETPTQPAIGGLSGYDTAIDDSYQHSMGIRKGWLGR